LRQAMAKASPCRNLKSGSIRLAFEKSRFAIRFSNAAPFAAPATITVEHPFQVPRDATSEANCML
jgi:hypothetical protein